MTEQRVDDAIEQRVDGEVASVAWYRSTDSARYALVGSVDDEDARIHLSTVLLDVDDESLRVLEKNSMWLPDDWDVVEVAIQALARAANASALGIDDEPRTDSLLDLDAETFGSYRIDDDYRPTDPDDPWQASEGPMEMYQMHDRLAESPIEDPDRIIRLDQGSKDPYGSRSRKMFHPDHVAGNYGIEVSEDDDLVIVDVDDVEDAPLDRLPETLRSESPHGGEHRFYAVPKWREVFRERFDVLNPHPQWGEIRSQDGYVVGPGSELTDCKHGCCSEEDPGTYVLDDREIATIDADLLADLLEESREAIDA